MTLNYIWIAFILIAFVVALIRLLGYVFREYLLDAFGWVFDQTDLNVFADIMQSTFDMAKLGFELSLGLAGVMTLWLGIMKIGENGGMVQILSKLVGPFFRKLFPEIPENHPVFGSIIMNFSANMLGLDNAATPLGLKAMKQLQELNPNKEVASNSQIMFLVLNTSGLTLIPVAIMADRAVLGASNPADVFIPILLTTFCSSFVGLLATSLIQRINLFNKTVLIYLGITCAIISFIIYHFIGLTKDASESHSAFLSGFILFAIIASFVGMAFYKKVNVYESFIDGAKEGFEVAIKIVPFLIGILVAIGIFRASGAFDYIMDAIRWVVLLFTEDTRFVDALPTGMIKPLSGGGARGMMSELFEQKKTLMEVSGSTVNPADTFAVRLSGIFRGSTETTFYVLAVYFGSVGIKNTRYAVGAGLIADFTGIIAAIVFSYLFFG